MFFLQIPGETKLLSDYGILGIICVIFICTIVFLARFIKNVLDTRQKETQAQYDRLEQKFTKYMEEDREHMLEVIENNTRAINDFLNHKY